MLSFPCSVCPSQLLLLICFTIGSWSVFFVHKSLLLILSHQCTLTILHRHLLMKTCSLFIVQCEYPRLSAYTKTTYILQLNILILVAHPMVLDFHNLSIAPKTVLAFPSLASTSCSVPPLILNTLPRYANCSISSIGPFVKLMSASSLSSLS